MNNLSPKNQHQTSPNGLVWWKRQTFWFHAMSVPITHTSWHWQSNGSLLSYLMARVMLVPCRDTLSAWNKAVFSFHSCLRTHLFQLVSWVWVLIKKNPLFCLWFNIEIVMNNNVGPGWFVPVYKVLSAHTQSLTHPQHWWWTASVITAALVHSSYSTHGFSSVNINNPGDYKLLAWMLSYPTFTLIDF